MRETPGLWRRLIVLPRTISGIALGFALLTASVTLVLGLVTNAIVHEVLETQIDDQIDVETRALIEYERQRGFEALVATVRERTRDGQGYVTGSDAIPDVADAMGYIVLDSTGRRRAGELQAAMPAPGYTEFLHFVRKDGSHGVAQAMNSALPGGGRLLVAVDRGVIRRMDTTLFWLFALGFGSLLVIAVGTTIGLGRIFRRRLAVFERLAIAVTAGEIDQRMPLDGSGVEFDRLALVVNGMLDRMSILVANLREVSTGLAHDLRTPLSRIRGRIERAEANTGDPAQQELLDLAVRDMDALLELFAGLLAISELDGQRVRSRFTAVDLAPAVAEIAEAHRPAIEDGGRTLALDLAPAEVLGDRPLLQRLIGNLLDNAMVHTPEGTAISVALEERDGRTILRVADDGPGIPAEDRGRIFDRLVRLDPSRSGPGHGLGLSMVAAIAAAHGGTAGAVPTDQGLTIEVSLPVA